MEQVKGFREHVVCRSAAQLFLAPWFLWYVQETLLQVFTTCGVPSLGTLGLACRTLSSTCIKEFDCCIAPLKVQAATCGDHTQRDSGQPLATPRILIMEVNLWRKLQAQSQPDSAEVNEQKNQPFSRAQSTLGSRQRTNRAAL